eukprot:3638682-Pyramimonas_sp.AAC.1
MAWGSLLECFASWHRRLRKELRTARKRELGYPEDSAERRGKFARLGKARWNGDAAQVADASAFPLAGSPGPLKRAPPPRCTGWVESR